MEPKIMLRIAASIVFFYNSMLLAQGHSTSTNDSAETETDDGVSSPQYEVDGNRAESVHSAKSNSLLSVVQDENSTQIEAESNELSEMKKAPNTNSAFGAVVEKKKSAKSAVQTDSLLDKSKLQVDGLHSVDLGNDSEPRKKNKPKKQNDKVESGFLKKVIDHSDREIKPRLFAHYEVSDEVDVPNHFEIGMARLNFAWTHGRVLEAVFEYDFANLIDGDEAKDGLRDLFIRVEPLRWFGVQMGQFKKPFSRIELTSRKRLPVFSRGEANDYIVDFLHYGDRDLGLMISGRLHKKTKLEYAIGVFNGGGSGSAKLGEGSKDAAIRLNARPLKWLSVGASVSVRIIKEEDLEIVFDPADYEGLSDSDYPLWLNPADPDGSMAGFAVDYPWLTGNHWMGGMDVAVRFPHFEGVVEGMMGENWWFEESPYIWSVSSIFSAPFWFAGGSMALEPALMAEMLTIEHESWTWMARMFTIAPGVNLHLGKNFRLMVHGQWIRTQGSEADFDEAPLRGFWPGEWPGAFADSTSLFVQVAYAN